MYIPDFWCGVIVGVIVGVVATLVTLMLIGIATKNIKRKDNKNE